MNGYVDMAWRHARRIVILVIGGTVVLLGVVGMLLPVVPGLVFIPVGLAILATEFVWARHWLRKIKSTSRQVWKGVSGSVSPPHASSAESSVSPHATTPRDP